MSVLTAYAAKSDPIRVMIVDDSAVVRGLVSMWVRAAAPEMEVATVAVDGAQAVKLVAGSDADVCVLDIEMPNMSGLEALPQLLAARPHMKVIMASTLTTRGADITLRALDLGAADYIPKPESAQLGGAEAFRRELVEKIRYLGQSAARRRRLSAAASAPAPARPPISSAPSAPPRGVVAMRPEVLVIGSSTGGPPALRSLLSGLGQSWTMPVVITQHMPKTFTTILAEHLTRSVGRPVTEAVNGEPLQAGGIYVAPGDHHLMLRRSGGRPVLALTQDPPENWCRPAVDPLFRSAAEVFGAKVLAMVLTGMGHDGRDGAKAIVAKGGAVIVQDEASSVVWGMPGAVAGAGLASLTAPIEDLVAAAKSLARGGSL